MDNVWSLLALVITGILTPVVVGWSNSRQEVQLKKALASIEQGQKDADAKRDEARSETQAKREAEAAWREDMERRMDEFEKMLSKQCANTNLTLRSQISQMRSDIVHKTHRYVDDLGCASADEKNAYDGEYREYMELCEAAGIENNFIDTLHEQVMGLPGRA